MKKLFTWIFISLISLQIFYNYSVVAARPSSVASDAETEKCAILSVPIYGALATCLALGYVNPKCLAALGVALGTTEILKEETENDVEEFEQEVTIANHYDYDGDGYNDRKQGERYEPDFDAERNDLDGKASAIARDGNKANIIFEYNGQKSPIPIGGCGLLEGFEQSTAPTDIYICAQEKGDWICGVGVFCKQSNPLSYLSFNYEGTPGGKDKDFDSKQLECSDSEMSLGLPVECNSCKSIRKSKASCVQICEDDTQRNNKKDSCLKGCKIDRVFSGPDVSECRKKCAGGIGDYGDCMKQCADDHLKNCETLCATPGNKQCKELKCIKQEETYDNSCKTACEVYDAKDSCLTHCGRMFACTAYKPNPDYKNNCIPKPQARVKGKGVPQFLSLSCTQQLPTQVWYSLYSRAFRCIHETMNNLLLGHKQLIVVDNGYKVKDYCNNGLKYTQLVSSGCQSDTMFANIQKRLKDYVYALLLVYVIVILLKLVSLGKVLGYKDFAIIAIKVGLILYFAVGDGWKDGYLKFVMNAGYNAANIFVRALDRSSTGQPQGKDSCTFNQFSPSGVPYADDARGNIYAVFDMIDCKFKNYIGYVQPTDALSIGDTEGIAFPVLLLFVVMLMLIPFLGPLIAPMIMTIFIMLVSTILQFTFNLITAVVILSFLIFIAPLIIPMVLFDSTKTIYNIWLSHLIGYTIYPLMLLASVSLVFFVLDYGFYGTMSDNLFEANGIINLDECSVWRLTCAYNAPNFPAAKGDGYGYGLVNFVMGIYLPYMSPATIVIILGGCLFAAISVFMSVQILNSMVQMAESISGTFSISPPDFGGMIQTAMKPMTGALGIGKDRMEQASRKAINKMRGKDTKSDSLSGKDNGKKGKEGKQAKEGEDKNT